MFNQDITDILLRLPAILIGFTFHEFAHALASDKLGDPTPRLQGRLTLSPLAHLDPIGFILAVVAKFGWAKPVETNPRHYKNPRRDDFIVSFAGPFSNFIIALISALIVKLFLVFNIFDYLHNAINSNVDVYLYVILQYIIRFNVLLIIFNLLPIPPLDGSHILESLTNIERFEWYYNLKRYSMIIMIIIIVTPVASYVIRYPINTLYTGICNLFNIPVLPF